MDIKWKDGNGNILDANKERIIYFDACNNSKTTLTNKEIKKITIEDGLMNVFKDFENGLELTIVIPKKNRKDVIKIFNEYDKTGEMYNRGTGNIFTEVFLNVFLDLSLSLINPIAVMFTVPLLLLLIFAIIKAIAESVFGDTGTYITYVIVLGYPIYLIFKYIFIRIKRKSLKENKN